MDPQRNKYRELNGLGIIPGPDESEEQYAFRAEYCLGLKDRISTELYKDIPLGGETEEAHGILKEAFERTKSFYDIAPDWVPLFFSNYQLRMWQGGCVWIFQVADDSPPAALIQLRQNFRSSSNYLRMYDREELLAHELSHAGRLAFKEAKFEEFFAYRSSNSPFRRWFGPIIKSSFESLMFVIVLIFILLLDISMITLGSQAIYPYAIWAKLVPLAFIAAALFRLAYRHRQFQRCFEKLETILRNKIKANAVIYRLTDLEIIAFSRMTIRDIIKYMEEQKEKSFRWKVIAECYLEDPNH